MASRQGRVKWLGDEVKAKVTLAADTVLGSVALQIVGEAKIHIVENDQVDTSFLLNSGYASSTLGSTYGQTDPEGEYRSEKTGRWREHTKAAEEPLPGEHTALVGFAATYALPQEALKPYLWPALQDVIPRVGGIIHEVGKKELPRR